MTLLKMCQPNLTFSASAFTVLDHIPDKKRGSGAVVCMCPEPGMLRENVFQIPAWYI